MAMRLKTGIKSSVRKAIERRGYVLTPASVRPSGLTSEPAIEADYFDLIHSLKIDGEVLDANQETVYTLYCATRYVATNEIEGDLIECGVGSGPKIALMCATLIKEGVEDRDIYLYDTFEGLTEPSEKDFKLYGTVDTPAAVRRKWDHGRETGEHWGHTPLERVRENVFQTGYPEARLHFIQGDVRSTIPNDYHRKIAILRLDTNFYDSSLHELQYLFELVAPGGTIILDDYGSWTGQKSATDEFFRARDEVPLLIRTSSQERIIVKV